MDPQSSADSAVAIARTIATARRKNFRRAQKKSDITADLQRYVEQGEPVDLPADIYAPCGALTWTERPPFHRGFDIQATQAGNNVITGTIVDGPAYRAGLRDGMRLVRRSGGEVGNAEVEIGYDVMDGETPRTLRWMPQGPGVERFRVLAAVSEANRAACEARLGGI